MDRKQGIYVIVILVSVLFFAIQMAYIRYGIVKGEQLKAEFTKIKHDLEILDYGVKLRDSMLMVSIESSYRKIEELTEIRKMNQKQIDSLHDVILDDIKGIEDIKGRLLDW